MIINFTHLFANSSSKKRLTAASAWLSRHPVDGILTDGPAEKRTRALDVRGSDRSSSTTLRNDGSSSFSNLGKHEKYSIGT